MNKPEKDNNESSRRAFLKRSACAVGFPTIVSSGALGLAGTVAPSNRVTMGFIGCGGRMNSVLGALLRVPGVQAMAVSDVWQPNRDRLQRNLKLGPKDSTVDSYCNNDNVSDNEDWCLDRGRYVKLPKFGNAPSHPIMYNPAISKTKLAISPCRVMFSPLYTKVQVKPANSMLSLESLPLRVTSSC